MKKSFTFLTIFLCSICLLSVGFSAWIISGISTKNVNANVSVGDLIQNNLNLLSINEPKSETFSVCNDGIVQDDTIVNEGIIIFGINLDVIKASNSNLIKNDNISYKVSILSNDLTGVFQDQFFVGGELIINEVSSPMVDNISRSTINGKDVYSANITLPINTSLSIQPFEIKYTFKNDILIKFKDLPKNTNPKFSLRLENIY